jgi:hypothetical protein
MHVARGGPTREKCGGRPWLAPDGERFWLTSSADREVRNSVLGKIEDGMMRLLERNFADF